MARAATTTDAFNAVAEPRRRQILDLLADGGRPVNDLVQALGIPQPLVSKHLRVLREVGLVQVHDRGRQRIYRLDGEPLQPIYEWVRRYERTWSARYDILDSVLDELTESEQVGIGTSIGTSRREAAVTATTTHSAVVSFPADTQILITRDFNAPRHLVYRAHVEPELIKRWWAGERGQVDSVAGGPAGRRPLALRHDGQRWLRGRLPWRVPGDRAERADRVHRGVRGGAERF